MAQLQTWTVTAPYVDSKCQLGEGPYYEKETNTLRFLDIMGHRLHTVDLSKGPSSLTTMQLDTPISVTADIEGVNPAEKILIGAKYGLAILDRKSGKYEYLAKLNKEDNKRLRGNDGAVDMHGRMWIGTMSDFDCDLRPEGESSFFYWGRGFGSAVSFGKKHSAGFGSRSFSGGKGG
jgi:sugar lactone lactonase YvrE